MLPVMGIIVSLQVDGLHCWPGVLDHPELSEVSYLADLHRHTFYIKVAKKVKHNDRDIEIIKFKHEIEGYLRSRYYDSYKRCHEFGSMSCEMIAVEIFEKFDCEYVQVLEDNENGAYISA